VNGTEGISDIEGKAATGSGERAGEASEFQISVSIVTSWEFSCSI
jgi:hypothetical protein